MTLISKSRLTSLAETRTGFKNFSDFLNEAKAETRSSASVTVFLSHSHDDLDKNYVNRVIVLLRKSGVKVYIDSFDSNMPPFTNAQTANRIKEAIKGNRKFLLLATNNAINSKWCNWELGYGDALKYLEHIALFPLTEDSGDWKGQEYLRIYPRIEESSNENFKVIYPSNHEKSLVEWLRY